MTALLITEPGRYTMPELAYHADPVEVPSLSSSIAKILIHQTPRHAWWAHPRLNPDHESATKAAFDLGHAAHSLVLQDQPRIVLVDADSFRTKEAKAQRDDAYKQGLTPLLPPQYEQVQMMATACRAQLDAHEDAAEAFVGGVSEEVLVWRIGDIWCRCRVDWMSDGGAVVIDYKTTGTSVAPGPWARHMYAMGYDIQQAFYRRGIREVMHIDPVFRFVCQEVNPPYALAVYDLPPQAMDMADAKVDHALSLWHASMATGDWPGYSSRTISVDPPAWQIAQWQEQQEWAALEAESGDDRRMNWEEPA